MMTSEIFKKFVETWDKSGSLKPVPEAELAACEQSLGIHLPISYKHFIKSYGPVYTPDILDAIVDQEVEFPDVQNFIQPSKAIEETVAYENAGMPKGYLAFASDCMGNLFCFKLEDCIQETEDCPVWLFDHDFVEMERVSQGIVEWLSRYAELSS